jgi:hypothetical protein
MRVDYHNEGRGGRVISGEVVEVLPDKRVAVKLTELLGGPIVVVDPAHIEPRLTSQDGVRLTDGSIGQVADDDPSGRYGVRVIAEGDGKFYGHGGPTRYVDRTAVTVITNDGRRSNELRLQDVLEGRVGYFLKPQENS